MKKYLQELRKAKGLTMEKLSKKIGIPTSTIGHFEGGTRTLTPRYRKIFAEFYAVNPVDIIQMDGAKPSMVKEEGCHYGSESGEYQKALRLIDDAAIQKAHAQAVEQEQWDLASFFAAELAGRKKGGAVRSA